jgi:hypothetical protein
VHGRLLGEKRASLGTCFYLCHPWHLARPESGGRKSGVSGVLRASPLASTPGEAGGVLTPSRLQIGQYPCAAVADISAATATNTLR